MPELKERTKLSIGEYQEYGQRKMPSLQLIKICHP
jgi:hypothetical protein